MKALELLAPARTTAIGIAAIDCGADAVYIAGPAFGARQAAGNSVEDIRTLCQYAHAFGVRIYVTLNTLVYDEELEQVRALILALEQAGVDALIVQDPAVVELARGTSLVLHASTQCAIRTPEKARFVESLGYGRLVLERALSLEQIRAIHAHVDAEIECFVHGALCVCYSGQCYLSEYLAGRSANRGACIQACRSLYDLEDENGNTLARNKALLSLKDLHLLHRMEEMAEAGVDSFKIEGRLKGLSYVRNTVRAYSEALDEVIARHPGEYCRASYGKVRGGGFVPDLEKTFNRGYTAFFLDGKRGLWSSMDAPKSIGTPVGTVRRLRPGSMVLTPEQADLVLHNGDGFAFVARNGRIVGFRGDVCEGFTIYCKQVEGLSEGMRIYRNSDAAFEKRLEAAQFVRELDTTLSLSFPGDGTVQVRATTEDGRETSFREPCPLESARDQQRMRTITESQMEKASGIYRFRLVSLSTEDLPFMTTAFLNGLRRKTARLLDAQPCHRRPLRKGREDRSVSLPEHLSYKANIANAVDREVYGARGAVHQDPAYELAHPAGVELMRSKYCLRHELNLCPRQRPGVRPDPLFLRNQGKRLALHFHCDVCEITVEP